MNFSSAVQCIKQIVILKYCLCKIQIPVNFSCTVISCDTRVFSKVRPVLGGMNIIYYVILYGII